MNKWIKWTLTVIASIFFGLWLLIYAITFHPSNTQPEEVSCKADTPVLKQGQKLKVLNWNVQYMGSKRNIFWYDISAELLKKGEIKTVDQPSKADVNWTINEVARVIKAENPDIVLLQEVDQGADRTYNINQTNALLEKLQNNFGCHSHSYYWKADFVPHPRILGSVGMQVVTLSKYKIEKATRHQLALIPESWLTQQFNIKRAVLETQIKVEGAKPVAIFNTHLSAFSQGSNTMQKQVKKVHTMLTNRNKEGLAWFIGGDFNLIPPGVDRKTIHKSAQYLYQDTSEIALLFKDFKSTASTKQLTSTGRKKYFTHVPNNPNITKMDRTIDYIFYSNNLDLKAYTVRQHDTQKISDHLPLIAEFTIPTSK